MVGSGCIGTLRARLAAKHPAVSFLALSDLDPQRARSLADQTNADFHSGDNFEVIERPEVTAVIVSTPEGEHSAPVRRALELGKPVLVEKPISLSLRDADDILETVRRTRGDLRIGYSRRYKECFLRAKEQMLQGRLGTVVGGIARVYNGRAVALNILQRDPHATPVLDVLTYYVDLVCWFLEGNRPVEVVARGQRGIFTGAGYDADDVTSEKGFPAGYLPDHRVNMAFLGANSGGDWALGDFWGSIANETRAWIDSIVTGNPTVHTTPEQARINLETTLAIVRAVESGKSVRLPLET